MKNSKKKNGISLITLIITIIIIIILAGAIILSLVNSNIINKAKEANFKNIFREYENELLLWITKEYEITLGSLDISTVNATKDSGTYTKDSNVLKLKDIITSMRPQHEDILEIEEGKLIYVGVDDDEKLWVGEIGIGTDSGGSGLRPLDVVVGYGYSALLMSNGTVKMWGYNSYGQLGNGTNTDTNFQSEVPGLTNVKQISAGDYHMLALLSDGTVKAFGRNTYGQLGNATNEDSNIPVTVQGLANVKQISCGDTHSLALLNDGTVMGWGENISGEVGDGTFDDKNAPVAVLNLSNVKEIVAGGNSSFALLNDGTAKVWGYNGNGQLGNGTNDSKNIPIALKSSLQDISLLVNTETEGMWSEYFTGNALKINLTSNYSRNSYGLIIKKIRYIENGETFEEILAEPIVNIDYSGNLNTIYEISKPNATSISVNFALLSVENTKDYVNILNSSDEVLHSYTGSVYTDSLSLLPSTQDLGNIKQIAARYNTFIVLNDGTVKVCGTNWTGELGIDTSDPIRVPTEIPGLSNVERISAGHEHTVAVLGDGTVKGWGYNYSGQLGAGREFEESYVPVLIPGITNVNKMSAGLEHSLILQNDGTVKSCGLNQYGQLGDGTKTTRYEPVTVDINFVEMPPIVAFSQDEGDIHSLTPTVTKLGNSLIDNSTLQYVWDSQNITAPTSGWLPFVNEGIIERKNINETEYLWITAADTENRVVVTKSNAAAPIPEVVVNKPLLATGMTAKKWNGSAWETVLNPDTDTSWYHYKTNKWPNAHTADGSMWVWIPRYEYKLPYPHTFEAQTIEVNFLNGTQSTATNGYTVHPAFTFGNVELTGIWVAKFEASGTVTAVNVKPNAIGLVSKTVSQMFTACRNMETTYGTRYGWGTSGTGIDTHLMKNTEWGAVAYLTQSIYGRNSKVWINSYSTRRTGYAGISPNSSSSTTAYPYNNTTYGINASTTGNIYGVYDMSGGAEETVAAYINNGNANLATYGLDLLNAAAQYKDVYNVSGEDAQIENYSAAVSIKGDAVYETSVAATGNRVWYGNYCLMPSRTSPFFDRGGRYSLGIDSGIFNFKATQAFGSSVEGFRPVLAVSESL